jgi:hypothetical protein
MENVPQLRQTLAMRLLRFAPRFQDLLRWMNLPS